MQPAPRPDDNAETIAGQGVDREGVPAEKAEPTAEPEPTAAPVRRRRWLRRLAIATAILILLSVAAVGGVGLYLRSVEGSIERVQAFEQVPEQTRPEKVAKRAMNILVLGSDTRDPQNLSGSRSDTIILVHLDSARSSAQLVSIPRDTWVHVPRSADGRHGNDDAKINAAYAWGGIPLVVQAVESFTRVRVDHVVVVDFAGFKEIVDALGGVEIDVQQSFTSRYSLTADGRRHFAKGRQVMDGATALDYARERYAFNDGDFTRIRHQQQVIKAILDKAASGGLLANPIRLNAFLRATADAVSVDESFNLFEMATELRHLRSDNLAFYTSPSKGTGTRDGESVVFPDTERTARLYDAVRRDAVAEIAAAAQ